VTTDLNTLLTGLYVKIDEYLGRSTRPGRPPKLSDAELLTLAVAQVLLGRKGVGGAALDRPLDRAAGRRRAVVRGVEGSEPPTHESLVSRETFLAAQSVSERRERSRSAAERKPHPRTQRTYRLRLVCRLCAAITARYRAPARRRRLLSGARRLRFRLDTRLPSGAAPARASPAAPRCPNPLADPGAR
jgi:hypothetical protein